MDPMIPFYSFQDIHSNIESDLFNSAKKIIQSGNYVFGTDKFEEEFAAYVGSKYCVAVSNGTSALHLALMSLGISEGDEVITVSHTFRATSAAVHYCGATPIFVDIDPNTFTMDYQQIESKITNKTKCILPVHIYGNASAMKNIISIANKYNVPVIEDCSQAHGTTINGKHVGTFGKLGTFSFYPGKSLGALGDAGCIVTDDKFLANNLKKNRSWDDNEIGFNYRMANIQAEFLRVKLKNFNSVLKEKQNIADRYNKHFSFVKYDKDVNHSFHIYPILHKNRDQLINKVKDKLELKVHYPVPVHRLPRYKQSYSLPITEKIASEEVSLPIYPGVDYNNVIEIVLENL